MTELRFFVPGHPAPGGSKRAFGIKKGGVYTGRFVVTEAGGDKTKHWRAAVGQAAADAMDGIDHVLLDGALEVELLFRMQRPKSHFKKGGIWLKFDAPQQHITRPDTGKLARATQDAMKGICYRDDSQIVREMHDKIYAQEIGCWIIIREISVANGGKL